MSKNTTSLTRSIVTTLLAAVTLIATSARAEIAPAIANAGPDASYVANAAGTATFQLDGTNSYHPTGEIITRYQWSNSFPAFSSSSPQATITLPVGVHVITLYVFVTDPIFGEIGSAPDTVTITITAAQTGCPTIVTPAQNKTVECDGLGDNAAIMAWINSHGGAVATTPSGTIVWTDDYLPSHFVYNDADCACGHVTVIFTASVGGCKVSTSATFTVVDTTAPTLVWTVEGQPVNDSNTYTLTTKDLPITVQVTPVDLCSGATLTKHTKQTISGCSSVTFGNGTFTITSASVGSSTRFVAQATDACGNASACEWVTIKVVQPSKGDCHGKDDDGHGSEDDDDHVYGGNDNHSCYHPRNSTCRNKHR